MVSQWNSSGIFSQDSKHCCSANKSKVYCTAETPEIFTRRKLFMSMFNDISCGTKDNEEEYLANARLISLYARRFEKDGHSLVLVLIYQRRQSTRNLGQNSKKGCLLEFADSGFPIFRAMTPLSRGQLESKGHGKLSIHFVADQETIETICRIIFSANQLSLLRSSRRDM